LTATAISTSQVNLTWSASADNVGVTTYDVYRGGTKVATVATTSYGDTGRAASTQYTYTVRARDAAGNVSIASNAVSVTTKAPTQTNGVLNGTVRNRNGRVLSGVTVTATRAGTTSRVVTRTSTDGKYVLSFPSGFSGQIQYSKSGFRTQTVTLNIQGGQVITRNVTLFRK
jgi:chitodextrinase